MQTIFKKKQFNPKSQNETNKLIKEPIGLINEIKLERKINDNYILAILDAGSRSTYISNSTAKNINQTFTPLAES